VELHLHFPTRFHRDNLTLTVHKVEIQNFFLSHDQSDVSFFLSVTQTYESTMFGVGQDEYLARVKPIPALLLKFKGAAPH
jgi:hypothetical protein